MKKVNTATVQTKLFNLFIISKLVYESWMLDTLCD